MAKIYIKTQGCSHNYADSEHMAGLLQASHQLVNDENDADVVLLNTCTVKTPTENEFLRDLKRINEKNKKIIIGGCIPQADPTRFTEFSRIGTRQLDHISEVVDKTLSGEIVQFLQRNGRPSLATPTLRRNPLIETIPISLGCLGYCSFCKTKSARGGLSSYPPQEIIDRVRRVTSVGVKEIWLTSQDTGCYGFDCGTSLPKLVEEIVKIEKDFNIRLGMANPEHILQIIDDLIGVLKHEKVFKFLHIPVQSGNNDVLHAMKREYTIEQFTEIVTRVRREIPDITLCTDIICGFPGETEEQFQDTIKLLKEIQPDSVNISRFWARPQTPAARLPNQITGKEIKQRSRILKEVFETISLEKNKRWIDWEGDVLLTEKGAQKPEISGTQKNQRFLLGKDNQWIGKNYAYKQVVVEGDYQIGDQIGVQIVAVGTYNLWGEVNEPKI